MEDNTNKTESKTSTLMGALVDLGTSWAAHGLDAGKLSLENSARMLERTAKTLETLARDLESKGHKRGSGHSTR